MEANPKLHHYDVSNFEVPSTLFIPSDIKDFRGSNVLKNFTRGPCIENSPNIFQLCQAYPKSI